jgi:hypothetical protein
VKSLLEKAIVHLLNGDEEKAESLFHKFMVEKARHIHESLRQDEDISLDENWDDETKSEEYFDGDDMGGEEPHNDSMDVSAEGDDVNGDVDVDVDADNMGGDDMEDVDVDVDAEGAEPDLADVKDTLDDIESQIHELTAEFDRLMGDEGVDDDMGMEGDEFETSEDGEDDFDDLKDEEPDLADRMDTDMSSKDSEPDPEHDETMESVDSDEDAMNEDENLDDITESVLAELDRISSPGNTDGKEIGSGGKSVAGNKKSILPNHGVNDRISGAKPVMVKGGNNDSFARETSPPVKGVETLVKGAKNSMARSDSKFDKKSKEGDASAKLNTDFAGGGEAKSKSIIGDGNPAKPKTR